MDTLSLYHWGPPKPLLTLTPADEAAWNLPLRVVTLTPLPQPPGIELPLCSYPSQTGVTNTSPTSLSWGCCVHGSTAIPHVCGHWCCRWSAYACTLGTGTAMYVLGTPMSWPLVPLLKSCVPQCQETPLTTTFPHWRIGQQEDPSNIWNYPVRRKKRMNNGEESL